VLTGPRGPGATDARNHRNQACFPPVNTGPVAAPEDSRAAGEVIRIISGIADQTNLLALNATIEIISQLDVVQTRMGEVLQEQARIASTIERAD
jgi:hypothetical protein